jgi:hypothetical protein
MRESQPEIVAHLDELLCHWPDILSCQLTSLFYCSLAARYFNNLKELWDIYLVKGERMLYEFILKNFELKKDQILQIEDEVEMDKFIKSEMHGECLKENSMDIYEF